MREQIKKAISVLNKEECLNTSSFLHQKYAFWSETSLNPPKFKGYPVDILQEELSKKLKKS